MRNATSVRPVVAEGAYRRRVAATSWQPGGAAGRVKWTSARELTPLCYLTFSTESLPKLLAGAPWETQLS
jgi:hypothetical protein